MANAECRLIYVYYNNITNEAMFICINIISCRKCIRVRYARYLSTRLDHPQVANSTLRLPALYNNIDPQTDRVTIFIRIHVTRVYNYLQSQ